MNELLKTIAKAIEDADSEQSGVLFEPCARAALRAISGSIIGQALRDADNSLGSLRRGYGVEVSALCYPARNTVDQALSEIRIAIEED